MVYTVWILKKRLSDTLYLSSSLNLGVTSELGQISLLQQREC